MRHVGRRRRRIGRRGRPSSTGHKRRRSRRFRRNCTRRRWLRSLRHSRRRRRRWRDTRRPSGRGWRRNGSSRDPVAAGLLGDVQLVGQVRHPRRHVGLLGLRRRSGPGRGLRPRWNVSPTRGTRGVVPQFARSLAVLRSYQLPPQGVDVLAVQDRLEMQVAAGRRTARSHLGDRVPAIDGLAHADGDALQVVVTRDQTVAVIHLDAVPTAPQMPSDGTDSAGVGREDRRTARCGIVLARVELTGLAGDGAGP